MFWVKDIERLKLLHTAGCFLNERKTNFILGGTCRDPAFFSALKAHISCDLLPHAIPHVKTYSFR